MRTRHYNDKPSAAPMELGDEDLRLVEAIQRGLPLVARPYAAVAAQLGSSEEAVIERIAALQQGGIIKRLGVVVRHRELGYRANAMVVWDVPDEEVAELGRCLSGFEFVTLCYRRPRHLPQWSYNLFCMIHGKDRQAVLEKFNLMVSSCGLEDIPRAVLFSRRRFKQRGAIYRPATGEAL
jgi:DNA-binding Lrp family transcriptional regulator